jgi:hypothetical protein
MNSRINFTKHILILISLITFSICAVDPNVLYDSNTCSVINLTKKNFDTQIISSRSPPQNMLSFVHYYQPGDGQSSSYKEEFKKLANEYEGMFKIAAMNCKDFKDICEKQDIREYPTFMMYPPLPAPIMKYEGKFEIPAIVSYLGKFISNKVQELNNNNIDTFTQSNLNLPKVILFTDKKGIPLIFKALSVKLDKTIEFGIVRSTDSAITSKYKVTKFPKIMAIGVDKKTKFYEGDLKYKAIFEFVNVYSETYHRVGEDKIKASDVTKKDKPWLSEVK